jgi:hypothetical protein
MDFPREELSVPADAKFYEVEVENPVIRTEFEGGYVASRPRHNRGRLRRIWTTGYTALTAADKQVIEDFWNETKGGSLIFTWFNETEFEAAFYRITHDPTHPGYNPNLTRAGMPAGPHYYRVRFADKLRFVRSGFGNNIRYNLTGLKLEEV